MIAQPAVEITPLVLADPFAGALERRLEPLVVERLQQVVQRMRLEGTQRKLVVGRDEDDDRHTTDADRLKHVETIDLRHLDVEEEQIRR